MNKYQKLFEPLSIGKLKLKNRISMAPMGLVFYSDPNGGFNENAQNYYVERAKGGTGLIITGICNIDYNEVEDLIMPCPTYRPALFCSSVASMIERIHAYDTKIMLQLTGGLGRSAIPGLVKKHIAPSINENRFDPSIIHREMTTEEIQVLINNFIKSAAIAKQGGFDGVEIHAVHEGYLLDQFAISFYNKRTDEYGGDLRARLKIATDVVKGVKKACGEDFPVSLRFSVKSFIKALRQGILPGEEAKEQGKDLEEGLEAAKILVEAGYDMLNVDAGTYDSWYWNHPPMYFEKGMYREFGRAVKKAVDVPVILAGRLDNPDIAMDALNGCCDIVSYGRPLLADPYLPEKIRTGNFKDIRPCLSCHDGCMGRIATGSPLSCAVNPACGREKKYGLVSTDSPKKVLVIGGGLAGMECARTATIRGHKVTIVEKSSKLGGNIIPGSVPDFKTDDRELIKWYEYQLEKLSINVIMNTPVDKAYVESFDADIIVVATGSSPININFGSENNVYTANDVLLDVSKAGNKIVVVGGGLVGCEAALWLAQMGKKVSVVEMQSDILGGPHGMPMMNYSMLVELLAFNNVDVYKNTKVEKVNKHSVVINNAEGQAEISADTVITAVGYRQKNDLYNSLNAGEKVLYNIGDSREVHNIMNAIWSGYELGRSI
ncbi:FAD-dependent oxidoreductase [Clostridium bowmanii]|uniref:oxidoreductase n=1 Tax=Clostridium bowmanii TaxID=132925 RepID=UPI001C0DEE17|nr:FAD-dependent oxidoreductase [Clostridium bowmanii]MBU3188293.1 FAD-dependent oxidoreductase [Clostridium bowmanii]MCA1072681.1 FAD-dependent oxidoreductase [Clostridium bowmanii]